MIYDYTLYLKYTLALAGGSLGYLAYQHLRLSLPRTGEPPVRWSWLPIIGWAIELGKRPIDFMQECAGMYGDIFGIVVGGHRMFIISDALSTSAVTKPVKHLHHEEFQESVMMLFFNMRKETFDKKAMDGDLMRKYFSTYLLSDKHLHLLTLRMQHQLERNIGQVVSNQDCKLLDFVSRFIFKASLAAMFNEDVANMEDGLFESFLTWDSHMAIAAGGFSLNHFPKAAAARDLLTKVCDTRAQDLSELILMRWKHFNEIVEAGKMKSDESAKAQLAMFWASVANTMPSMFWVIYYLLLNPKAMADIKKEIASVYKGANQDVTQEDMNQMIFTDAVITEALRLSSGSLIMRYVREPLSLTLANGKTYKFRKGDRVGLCPPLFHHDGEIFKNPKEFNPYRWMQGETMEEKVSAALGKIPLSKNGVELSSSNIFLPFGAGITYCPGRRFARNEIKLLTIFLLSRFQFELLEGPDYVPEPDGSRAGLGIFSPKVDAKVRVTKL